MDELQPCALQGNVPLEPAAIFAVSVKRVLPGGKLHPDLMRPPGVERDLRKAQGTVRCRLHDAVFQHGFPHALAGAADREDPAFPAVLEQIVPQDALGWQLFVRPACDHGPVCFKKAGLCRCTGASLCSAVQNGISLLALRHLFCQSRCGSGCSGIDHQPRNAGVQPVDDAHIGVGPAPVLPQGSGDALLAGKTGGLVQHHKGSIFVENVHSLPSSNKALSLSTPAMVLPSLISPLMTIS